VHDRGFPQRIAELLARQRREAEETTTTLAWQGADADTCVRRPFRSSLFDGFAPGCLFRRLERKAGNMELLWFLIIGIAAGWLAGQLMKGGGYGLIGDLVIGVIGALIGGWLFGMLGIFAGGLIGRLITATIGAVVLLFLIRLIKRG